MQELILLLLKATAIYFLTINIVYGVLMLLSWLKIKRFRRQEFKNKAPTELPAVSFIIPAFNEESLIVETLQTYLQLPQENKEVIVINDGSHDHTMDLLKTMYQLTKVDEKTYKSITHPELRVLKATHLGKSQALNLGIKEAQYDLVCTMDADTIPTARGVEACLRAFATDKKLVAAGGVIQVLNSKNQSWLNSFQRIEYLRTFVCERLGWSFLGSTILISGAFCMIKKEAINRIGGFNPKSITEDLDLIVRLRRAYYGEKHRFRILPVTTCYTQVPNKVSHLKLQRIRWQLGLVQTLYRNLPLFLHPGHGPLGLFAIPYFWLVEIFSPIMEGIAFLVVPYAIYQKWLPLDIVMTYLGVGLIFNLFITLLGVYADNKYISRARNWSCITSTIYTMMMHFGYKQLNSWWRFRALLRSFRKNNEWGEKPREEILEKAS